MSGIRRIGRREQLLQGQVEIIDTLYAAATDPDRWPEVIVALEKIFHEIAAILHRRGTPLRTDRFLATSMDPAFVRAYETHFAPLNPWEIGTQDGFRRPVLLVNDGTLPPEVIDKSEFQADWLRPQGDLRFSVNGAARLGPEETVELVITRSRRAGPFDEAEAQALLNILPHLQRVVDLSKRLALAEAGQMASLEAARPLGIGVALVDAFRTVLSLDPEAERILQSGGLSIRQGRLRASGILDERLAQAVSRATGEGRHVSGRTGDLLTVPRGEECLPLSVAVGPLDDRQRPLGLSLLGPLAIVVISAPERSVGPNEEGLRALFDLTPAEARLVVGLCAGQTLAEYAGYSGTSMNTIKTHLKRVFDKIGETRQADLVRRVTGDVALRFGSTPQG